MKRELKALTVAVSLIASGASAFEMNISHTEQNRIRGARVISELTVGIQALISSYGGLCAIDGKLYLSSYVEIETDPSDYIPYYRIQLEPDGEFTMTYGPSKKGDKTFPFLVREPCEDHGDIFDDPELTFIPVKSINGFTDTRSLAIDLANKGYK
jgi:hypothetical protein